MARDYFAVLGLRPECYSPQIITRCFQAERTRLLRHLHDPLRYSLTRRHLEELHLAYATLRDPDRQEEYRNRLAALPEPVRELRALIGASLEDGLLRHSRRQGIIARARELGFNDFQAHLLIAQVQFGDERTPVVPTTVKPPQRDGNGRGWARLAGVGMLAVTMFLVLVRMFGG
jgi:hypothetical protein